MPWSDRWLDRKAHQRTLAAIAPSTRKNHHSHWTKFSAFLRKRGLSPATAERKHTLRFLEYLVHSKLHPNTIKNYLYSLRSVRKRLNLPLTNFYHHTITDWLKGLDRTVSKPARAKPYIKRKHLRKILLAAGNHKEPRLIKAFVSLAFHSMLRLSNLVVKHRKRVDIKRNLLRKHVTIKKHKIVISLPWSKTLQELTNSTVICVPATHDQYCPVRLLSNYVNNTVFRKNDPLFKFKNHTFVSRSAIRSILYKVHTSCNLFTNNLAHSYRRGGAIMYYRKGVPLEEIKRLGTWKSDAIFVYIKQATHSTRAFRNAR